MAGPALDLLEDGLPKNRKAYEWWSSSVNVAGTGGDTDISGVSGFTSIFTLVKRAHHVKIVASATTYIRLNTATDPKMTLDSATSYESYNPIVEKIFISTNGGASTVTIYMD